MTTIETKTHAERKLEAAKRARHAIRARIQHREAIMRRAASALNSCRDWNLKHEAGAAKAVTAQADARDAWLASGSGAAPQMVEYNVEGSPFSDLASAKAALAEAERDVSRSKKILAGLRAELQQAETVVSQAAENIEDERNAARLAALSEKLELEIISAALDIVVPDDIHVPLNRLGVVVNPDHSARVVRTLQALTEGLHTPISQQGPIAAAMERRAGRVRTLCVD